MRLRLDEDSEERKRFGDGNGLDEKEWFREIERGMIELTLVICLPCSKY